MILFDEAALDALADKIADRLALRIPTPPPAASPDRPKLLRESQVAALANVSPRFLRGHRLAGRIKACDSGRPVLYDSAQVLAAIEFVARREVRS